ncbi:MAG: hypothetical protein AAGI88_05455 [Pseudomonadota bacterium]
MKLWNAVKPFRHLLKRATRTPKHRPKVSLVLVVHKMPMQAANTIRSLLPDYQRGCDSRDYEVIIVENRSCELLDSGFVKGLPDNFRYILRDETAPTPVFAVNEAAQMARSDMLAIMIDGARLLTPGIVSGILRAQASVSNPVVSVPGYHLGSELQQKAVVKGYDASVDQRLLASVDWLEDGYRLFEIACLSGSCAGGFFLPNSESNCLAMPVQVWNDLGGMDLRFTLRGGGMVNLDLYRRACEHPGIQHVVLPGEGTFHQFHGGVTTGGEPPAARDVFIEQIQAQYRDLRGQDFASPLTHPIYLGGFHDAVLPFLQYSSDRAIASRRGAPSRELSGPRLVADNENPRRPSAASLD